MRLSAVVWTLVVSVVFAGRVCAQTFTPGELRATAVMADAQVTADALRRRVDAPTLTPRPTLTPTDTPAPTSTATVWPTATDTPAPLPTATPTMASTSTSVAMAAPVATPKPTPTVAQSSDRTATYLMAAVVVGLVVVAVWALLFRPQSFVFPNRPRR